MEEEQSTSAIDFYAPLKDYTLEVLAGALAGLLREERPDAEWADLMYAARKIVYDGDNAE